MKAVCIVGAGPAGLVAAKTLLQTQTFNVTVYEKNPRIGGIWALNRNSTGGFLSPYTPTNLSRFTVSFSDLDWNSVDFNYHEANGLQNGASQQIRPPIFPKAWMANRYLETYRKKYIPDGVITCNRNVVNAERIAEKWQITTRDEEDAEETREFDYLIIASGFFAQPRLMKQNISGLTEDTSTLPIRMIHSSAYRNLNDLFPKDKDVSGKKILMIGGGNSSGETAAAVALHLSDAQWSPITSSSRRFKDCKIVHVTPRPIYPIPPFVECEEGSKTYVPLDFRLYDFSRRPGGMESYAGQQTKAVKDIVHNSIQTIVGGDLSDISSALVSRKGHDRGSAYVALTEGYSEYVRSGLIEVLSGRVSRLESGKDGLVSAILKHGDDEVRLDDVAAVIYATGYTPCPALEMLDDATKAAIKFDPNSMRLPMILDQWQTMNTEAPTVSFLGFYEGPYWPMIEMQAHLTARRWLSGILAPQKLYETQAELLKLRQHMENRSLDIPQFWFNDYMGYLEDIANELGFKRNHQEFDKREGCTSPARYVSTKTNRVEADAIVKDLYQTWHDCTVNGRFVPRAAFRALQGNWNISRRIESALSTFPSGTLDGTASFLPRFPTPDKSGKSFDFEYLYIESGLFKTSTGHSLTASRHYVYRYSEAGDMLSIWFVKPENNLEVDYLFHDLKFLKPHDAREGGAQVAQADHLCVDDMYWTEYRLPLKGIALHEFEVKHTVRGPSKDYVATTKYDRPKV